VASDEHKKALAPAILATARLIIRVLDCQNKHLDKQLRIALDVRFEDIQVGNVDARMTRSGFLYIGNRQRPQVVVRLAAHLPSDET